MLTSSYLCDAAFWSMKIIMPTKKINKIPSHWRTGNRASLRKPSNSFQSVRASGKPLSYGKATAAYDLRQDAVKNNQEHLFKDKNTFGCATLDIASLNLQSCQSTFLFVGFVRALSLLVKLLFNAL
ncbi:hypothetical protein PoB_003059500 [Plakobranchus ocellatus]|uniref:Uncharacterized protein n=1 Tax=Plakobranchus ocellatus TaxID=259542 RepID=A0AAV4A7F6_9GAST|nr:hypothetical protein PoB_003059500 [Plakobranchus ocellatus]